MNTFTLKSTFLDTPAHQQERVSHFVDASKGEGQNRQPREADGGAVADGQLCR